MVENVYRGFQDTVAQIGYRRVNPIAPMQSSNSTRWSRPNFADPEIWDPTEVA